MQASVSLTLAFRNLVRQRRKTLTAIAAVCFGIVAMILASGFIEWNLWFGRESTIRSQLGHVQISRPGYHDAGRSDPFSFLVPDNPQELGAIAATPGVRAVGSRLSFSGLISHGEATVSFIGEGVEPDKERLLSDSITVMEGEALSEQEPRGITLGYGLASNLGVTVGDTVVLLANTASGGVNAVECRVIGLFSTVTKAYDDTALRAPLPTVRSLLRVSGSHVWVVLLDETERTQDAVEVMQARLKGQSLQVVPWFELADFYNKTSELFRKQVGFMRLIIAVIIVLSISNTLLMSIMERTGEIGTSMALGSRRAGILRLFIWEGLLLGLIGGVLGVAIGYLLAQVISAIGVPMPPPPGMAHGYTAEIMTSWRLATDALILALGSTVMASLYPAWKASRMVIVDALRHNR